MGLISNGTTIFDNGSMGSGFGGSMVFIKKLTASASATLSFVDGSDGVVLDDTYKEYMFTFNNIHRSANSFFTFNMSSDTGSNYNVTKTTTFFDAYHNENGNDSAIQDVTGWDLAQGTGFQRLANGQSGNSDESTSGYLHLFNPSSSTYVKHFIARLNSNNSPYSEDYHVAGYGNTVSSVDAIQFKLESGNIDTGDICLYGIV